MGEHRVDPGLFGEVGLALLAGKVSRAREVYTGERAVVSRRRHCDAGAVGGDEEGRVDADGLAARAHVVIGLCEEAGGGAAGWGY